MFPERFTPAVELFLSLFILQANLHQAFSSDDLFCNNKQEESVVAINGQTIHVNFTVHKQQAGQHLVWNFPDSEFQLPFNMSIVNNASLQYGRYKLTYYHQGGNIYEMSIMLTEENDTGTHYFSLNERGRQLCFIFQLNLIIKERKPICKTLFDKKRGKLQMSCQWLQMNDGDRARLVAGDQVLYEHETSEMNLDGHYNITNKYSIFIPPEKLNDASTMPTVCDVIYSKTNKSKACRFSTVSGDLVRNNLTKVENATFKCCNTSWFVVNGNSVKRLTSTESISASFHIFLCGEEGDDSNMLVITGIRRLNFDIQENLNNISVLTNTPVDPNVSNYSSDGSQCNILTTVYIESISKGRYLSSTVKPATLTTGSQDELSNVSENTPVNGTESGTEQKILITIVVIIGFAFTLSMCVHFGNYLLKIRRKERCSHQSERNIGLRRNSATNFGNTTAESVEMTASSEVSRPSRDVSCRHTSDREEPDLNRATVSPSGSCSESQRSVPILPPRQDLMCRPFAHTKQKAKEQALTAGECPLTADCSAPGDRNSDHHYEHTESAVVPSAPSLDNTYCSLDDVEGGSANTNATDSHVSNPLPNPKEGLFDPYSITKACSSAAGTPRTSPELPLTDIRPNQRAEVEQLYAKPDMSRKTKKITPSESAYDDPRQPGEDFWQQVRIQNNDL